MGVRQSGTSVIDELQCLREDKAVEFVVRDRVCCGKVSMDRRLGVGPVDVQHIAVFDRDSETARVAPVPDLQHPAADSAAMLGYETLDEIPVDGRTSIGAPSVAQGLRPTKCSKQSRTP